MQSIETSRLSAKSILKTLADLIGLRPRFSALEEKKEIEALQTMLTACGAPCDTPEVAIQSIERRLENIVPPTVVLQQTESGLEPLSINLPAESKSVDWIVSLEGGGELRGQWSLSESSADEIHALDNGRLFERFQVNFSEAIAPGYHKLGVRLTGKERSENEADAFKWSTLVVAHARAFAPDTISGDKRFWGAHVHLPSVSSKRNWGIGDLTDLKMLVRWAAEQGAGLIHLDSLQTIQDELENEPAPVFSSRLFINPLFIDVEAMADFVESEDLQRTVLAPAFQEKLANFRTASEPSFGEMWATKLSVMEALYQHFRSQHLKTNTPRAQAFRNYQYSGGKRLSMFGLYEAINEQFRGQKNDQPGFEKWPKEYLDPSSAEVQKFADKNRERVEFFQYLQWVAEIQLQAAGQESFDNRMPIGLCHTVAYGCPAYGADIWCEQSVFAKDVELEKRDEHHFLWRELCYSPVVPEQLNAAGYQPFIALLRATMRYGGGMSLEDALEFQAPTWNLDNASIEMTYGRQFIHDLRAIAILESHRQKCAIIARHNYANSSLRLEDDAELAEHLGFIARRSLFLEKDEWGAFKQMSTVPADSLLSFGSREIPSLAVFWLGQDLNSVSIEGDDSKSIRNRLVDERVVERAALLRFLEENEALPEGLTTDPASVTEITPAFVSAVYACLAKSPAKFVVFSLEDVAVGEPAGKVISTGYDPSFPPRHTLMLEEFVLDDRVKELIKALTTERGAFTRTTASKVKSDALKRTAIPSATYRFQFNKEFPLRRAVKLIPYLAHLGVSHCYASPLLKANPGSMHGYDIVNHKELNPEIGSPDELDFFVSELKRHNLGLILDIVPNHMGIGAHNPWWMDVLENGPASIYADYFDIDWQPVNEQLHGKVLLPILGESYGSVVQTGQLKLEFKPRFGSLFLNYYDHAVPLNPVSYPKVLGRRLNVLNERFGANHPDVLEYMSILTGFQHLPNHTEPVGFSERIREKKTQMRRLAALVKQNPKICDFIEQNLADFDVKPEDSEALNRLHTLLEAQAYRLAYWRVSSDEVNYRRFFDVDSLAAIRTEDARVFNEMHELVFEWVKTGKVQGLRIDHPDGLFDPQLYFSQLQLEASHVYDQQFDINDDVPQNRLPIYLVVEKILAPFEHLEQNWKVHGTVGYEFLNSINDVLINNTNEQAFTDIYTEFLGESVDYEELKHHCKLLILDTVLASELNVLSHRLHRIAQSSWFFRDLTLNSLRSALRQVLSHFPVYRTYAIQGKVDKSAKQYIDWAVGLAKRRGSVLHANVYEFVRQVLTMELVEKASAYSSNQAPENFAKEIVTFAMKFQQFTGPVMAKSVEDTAFYRFNRFVGSNEVGGEPSKFGGTLSSFHHQNSLRQQKHPYEMLSTSTHDTKRSEDVRARLAVLSEIPTLWREKIFTWSRMNKFRKVEMDEVAAPDANDEYLFYQTLAGVCPLDTSAESLATLSKRVEQYILKAAKESKRHTSWLNQNQPYENALTDFVKKLLTGSTTNAFLEDFLSFHKIIVPYGLLNSLTQTLLKTTCPGVPDVYQGTEYWDFSLVDPDNRRPVDYDLRWRTLFEMRSNLDNMLDDDIIEAVESQEVPSKEAQSEQNNFLTQLLTNWENGQAKQFVLSAALKLRAKYPELFTDGKYVPLTASGKSSNNVLAFARLRDGLASITVAPIMVASAVLEQERAGGEKDVREIVCSAEFWEDTVITLPAGLQVDHAQNMFTLQNVPINDAKIRLSDILQQFPVGLLRAVVSTSERV
jgi:(1->4)-alpha-D-glucan 1-alpha-D-glucosylmutase